MSKVTLSVTVSRCSTSGALTLSTIVNGSLVRRRYIGYSRRDAIALFRSELS